MPTLAETLSRYCAVLLTLSENQLAENCHGYDVLSPNFSELERRAGTGFRDAC